MVVPFRYSQPFLGLSRRVHTSSFSLSELLVAGARTITWLVTELGQSSPGLICCLAMSLKYADLLYLWLCSHSLLDQGFRGLLACPSLSSLLWFCKLLWVLFSHMVHNLHDGVTPAGSRLVCPLSERRFHMFSLSLLGCFFVLSLPFGI